MAEYAVIIGISRYPSLGDLGGPENDGRAFGEWLTTKREHPVNPTDVAWVLSSGYQGPQPWASHVEDAFQTMLDRPVGPSGVIGERLYIYMAGHGFSPTIEDAALLMANAARGRTGYHIPGRPYANWFRRAKLFDEVILFMDCCRENYPRAPLRTPPWDDLTGPAPARHFYGFATDWSRAAREAPVGNPPAIRGKFTVALLEGLRDTGADPQTGAITGKSLSEFVYNTLTSTAGASEEVQEPKFDFDPLDDIVFQAETPPPFTVRLAHGATDGGRVALQDGTFTPVAPSRRLPTGTEWQVFRGLYLVMRADGTAVPLTLTGAGGTIDV